MRFKSSPEQLQILTQAVEEYCHDCGITDTDEQAYVAELVSALVQLGALDLACLRQGLDDAIGPCLKPTHH
ncbi:hypothetical protein [Mesorhizobium sp. YM1C-6-2]|uniref:hypothetical protein n=1 Tax=Mesorhizobium sp. YM1C-6-2 TaxID=1827501 RepID=UPI0015FF59AB|nr:hypothetical protein [Mesorhizobium sp. YM1C-6-2]